MRTLLAALLAAPLCAVSAQAQSMSPFAGDDVLTLDEALANAHAATPLTQAAEAGVWAAQAGRTVAALRPNPSISVDTENALGTGPYRGFDGSDTTVAFALPVELGGKRSARIAVADASERRAWIDLATADARPGERVGIAYAPAAERADANAFAAMAADHGNVQSTRYDVSTRAGYAAAWWQKRQG